MTTASLDLHNLLERADACAGSGDWSGAQRQLSQARVLAPHDAGVATGHGISLLRLGRLPDALAEFQHAARLAPDNAEVQNNLGFACALNGQAEPAESAFRSALDIDPEHGAALRNLAQLYLDQDRLQEGVGLLVSRVRSAPDDAEALYLLGTCYEEVDDAESARTLYRQALALRPEDPEFQTALARVAPTQPEAVLARPGLSEKLARLKVAKKASASTESAAPSQPTALPAAAQKPAAVAFYGAGEQSDAVRLTVPANALADRRHRVKLSRTPSTPDLQDFDIFVFSRPHLSGEHLQFLKEARGAGKTVVVDLDTDYFALASDHPRRSYLAGGEALALLELALSQADLVTAATEHLAEALRPRCRRVEVVGGGWSPSNTWWTKPGQAHPGVVLGWVGDPSQDRDLAEITPLLQALLHERPEAQLAIAGSPGAYQAFDAVPETRKLFLPMVGPDDFPYLLAHFDALLVPVRERDHAALGNDQRLMEAGARGLPWLASPAPALTGWSAGGQYCATTADWVEALKRMVDDFAWRQELRHAGRAAAASRRADQIGARWEAVISGLSR